MKRYIKLLTASMLTAVVLLLAACQPWYDREPLEIYYDGVVQVRLDIDWMNHLGEYPESMTVLMAKDGDQISDVRLSNDVDRVYYRLGVGNYKVLVFNYSYDDYATMGFENRQSYERLTARANDLTGYFNGAWDRGITYMQKPGLIGVAVDTFNITQEDIDQQRHFIDYRDRDKPDTLAIVRRETVYDMTCVLNVYVRTSGLKYMKSLVGSISGMADGFNMASMERNKQYGPLLLDAWFHRTGTQVEMLEAFKRTRNAEVTTKDTTIVINPDTTYQDDGRVHDWMCTRVSTFGLPSGDEDPTTRPEGTHVLTLCFTLLDGSKRTYIYDVSKFIRYRQDYYSDTSGNRDNTNDHLRSVQLDLDLIVDIPLDFPDLPYTPDPGDEGGDASGFDAIVDPWEKNDPIDITF